MHVRTWGPASLRAAIGLVELSRPGNVVMAALGAVIGAIVVAGADVPVLEVTLAAVATGLVVAGGNTFNDLTDRRTDELAHPHRPLPSGRVAARAALGFGVASFAIALALAVIVSIELLLVVAAAEAALAGYEVHLKAAGLVGNLVVAVLVGATFVAGGVAAGALTGPVVALAGLAFLANFGREVWKDLQDAPHDRGRRSIAVAWGERPARRTGQLATLAAVAISPVPYLLDFGGASYVALVAVADVVFLFAVFARAPERAQRLSKAAMLLALAGFAAGGVL